MYFYLKYFPCLQNPKWKRICIINSKQKLYHQSRTKLRGELPSLFSNQINNIIEIISERFEVQLKQKEEEISKAQNEKEQDVKAIEDKLLVNENIKEQIKTLVNNILYKRG